MNGLFNGIISTVQAIPIYIIERDGKMMITATSRMSSSEFGLSRSWHKPYYSQYDSNIPILAPSVYYTAARNDTIKEEWEWN
jgi:hypothetical protein